MPRWGRWVPEATQKYVFWTVAPPRRFCSSCCPFYTSVLASSGGDTPSDVQITPTIRSGGRSREGATPPQGFPREFAPKTTESGVDSSVWVKLRLREKGNTTSWIVRRASLPEVPTTDRPAGSQIEAIPDIISIQTYLRDKYETLKIGAIKRRDRNAGRKSNTTRTTTTARRDTDKAMLAHPGGEETGHAFDD